MKCPHHDRLEQKIDSLFEVSAETREDVAFLRGRVKETSLVFRLLGVGIGSLTVVGGIIAIVLKWWVG